MKRRQFLQGVGAVTLAAAIPATYATGGVVSGTVTGRFESKSLYYSYLYGRRGKSWAADLEVYRRCLVDPEYRVLRVENGQRDPLKWKTVQFGNQHFAELEKRVLAL